MSTSVLAQTMASGHLIKPGQSDRAIAARPGSLPERSKRCAGTLAIQSHGQRSSNYNERSLLHYNRRSSEQRDAWQRRIKGADSTGAKVGDVLLGVLLVVVMPDSQ
ncbi:MAG: hypothetical protein ACI83P_002419 [Janthinobacterium sp.]|jgi:hypothetical protein